MWVHAASVGEVMAATPILKEFSKLGPDWEVIVSVITPGGYEVASAMIGKGVMAVVYSPFDVPWIVRRSVRTIQPDLYMNLETELWPNIAYCLSKNRVPAIIVNGRISDKSIGRYLQIKPFVRWCLSSFQSILVQSQIDMDRFIALGAAPERTSVIGNAKFDQAPEGLNESSKAQLRASFGIDEAAPVLVFGSTRQEDEERILISAYKTLHARYPRLAVIHAPRHVDRAEAVKTLWKEAGYDVVRRSEMGPYGPKSDQVVLDTFGELANVYALATVVFIGNSLTEPGGGQNILQPLAQGKPVVYGPKMQNFRDSIAMAEKSNVGFKVYNPDELTAKLEDLLEQKEETEALAIRARSLIDSNRGVAARYAAEIAKVVGLQ